MLRLRAATDLPIGVGIGISNPAQAREASRIADVTIVGSALIRSIDTTQDPRQQADAAANLARLLKAGLRRSATPQSAAWLAHCLGLRHPRPTPSTHAPPWRKPSRPRRPHAT
ncbi:tryptophan synthase subunit alpha [Streptomyces sp. NBC_00996]|nr:tryptophan synthase subunit alpha [Streptomyces sp. NBC_00996]